LPPEKELELTKNLLSALNTIKREGETITDFNQRVEEETNHLLQIDPETKDNAIDTKTP
ncbi:hypothetical protein HYT52_03710, partial [Candidatus Woesearchaeota archaeon]|nr:hypothetical protein [Candidatus Woesearchaeota archaeon]